MRSSNYNPAGERGLFRRDRRLWLQRGTHTFTVPDGVTKVWAFTIGAGSGGAKCGEDSNNFPTGGLLGGGEGGGYASGIISGLTPGGTLTLTVGAGGNGAFETTASQAGGNTTVVGGSTTYLQGNGGAAASNTVITSDPGSKKGAGGGASTNSVTDAYTASGGGQYNWPAGVGYTGSATDIKLVMGGAASGTPWGTGMAGGKSVGQFGGATGGGGWCQVDFPQSQFLKGSSGNHGRTSTTSLPGYGSHNPPKYRNGRSQQFWIYGYNGGDGLTVEGGMSLYMNYFDTTDDYIYDNKNLEVYDTPGMLPQKVGDLNKFNRGKTGNPNWWFPWEIDGSGGGSIVCDNNTGANWCGGKGGTGAGGGAGYMSSYNNDSCINGGDGGFGGGGGGTFNSSNRITDITMSMGGNGGNGGGGGSSFGRVESSRHMPIAGNGGDGAIGIYW
jgi:hypothetical protein